MLRTYAFDFQGSWNQHLSLVEFAYNNYQASIGMASYETLYEMICHTPLCWDEIGESKLQNIELIEVIREK